MSEMVERVEDVIVAIAQTGYGDSRDMARQIIAAMREPTEGMDEAVESLTIYGREVWQAMIDKALEE